MLHIYNIYVVKKHTLNQPQEISQKKKKKKDPTSHVSCLMVGTLENFAPTVPTKIGQLTRHHTQKKASKKDQPDCLLSSFYLSLLFFLFSFFFFLFYNLTLTKNMDENNNSNLRWEQVNYSQSLLFCIINMLDNLIYTKIIIKQNKTKKNTFLY